MASPALRSDTTTTVNTVKGYQRPGWMLNAPGNLLLSELTMPGTHDSGARVVNLSYADKIQ